MVKTKQQKAKPKKNHHHVKKKGKQADLTEFRGQLDAVGLKIVQVTADGNCFFRSLADQLEGSEEEHGKYRRMVVGYIIKNREMFEPFIEDDVPFDEYCQNMDKDGTWAGHMELQAASLVTRSNICIHQFMLPRWYIRNFDQLGARMVHLSYHDEEHYNSVRYKEDPCDGPARPIVIKADADLSATSSHQGKSKSGKINVGSSKLETDPPSIKMAMSGSGCDNAEKVEEVLLLVDGDVDAAIEFLVAEQAAEDQSAENGPLVPNADTSPENQGNSDGGNSKQSNEDSLDMINKHDNSDDGVKQLHDDSNSKADDKHQIIPRNKVCPCGSKKKYKACCGAVKGRSSAKIVIRTVDTRKSKKDRKHGKKGGPVESLQPSRSGPGLPDVGALCI